MNGKQFHLNYTSGTTGDPKGVVYHHRGAYLGMLHGKYDDLEHGKNTQSYLWTLAHVSLQWVVFPLDNYSGWRHACVFEKS